MNKKIIRKSCYYFFLSLCISQQLLAGTIEDLPVLFLPDSISFQKITANQIGYLEDFEEKITVETIDQQQLSPLETRNVFEITQKDFKYWAVLKIGNQAAYDKVVWLDVPGNYVTAWVQRDKEPLEKYDTGNLLSQKDKSIEGIFRNFNYVPVSLKANEIVTVKLQIKTTKFFPIYKDAINMGTPIYFEKFQYQRLSDTSFLDGLYSAIMMLFCMYCFGYFLFTREVFSLWASCYSLLLIGYFFQFNSTWYRLGLSPVLVQQVGPVMMTFSLLLNLLFTKNYIKFESFFPRLYKVYSIAIYLCLGFIVFQASFYFLTNNYLLTILIVLVVHSLLYVPLLVLGFKLLKFRRLYIVIFSVGILVCHLLLLYNNFQLENLSNELLKLAVTIYIVSIMLSLSFRAAGILKEKVQAEAEILLERTSLSELKKLDGLKSNFFANVSHELRTPLTLILGPISSVIKNDQLSNRDFTLLKKAELQGQNLLKLVGSILDLSKLEAAKIELNESPESLYQLSRRIAATFESHAEQKNIAFSFSYVAEQELYVSIDREKLTVILNNLLSNAFKATPAGGRVDLTVADKGNALQFVLADTGRGIHDDDLPHIFNRFYQSNHVNTPLEGGTGIGLALCKEYSELMGGQITVESELGKGSTFTIQIKRQEVMSMIPSEKLKETDTITTPVYESNTLDTLSKIDNAPTVMIVEDNPSLRDYLATVLSPYYTLQLAENGKVALDLLNNGGTSDNGKTRLPDLILSDIMMPLIDGIQLLETLKGKETFKTIPVVMLTARADMATKLKALKIGVEDYLLKPFEEEELLARVENLLHNAEERATFNNIQHTEEKQPRPFITQEETDWLQKVKDLTQNHLSDNQFSISRMAKALAMSERNLQRQLKKLTGLTPSHYLQEIRLMKARDLLEQKRFSSIAKVAYAVGYSDAKAFSRRFKIRFGKSPSAY